MPAALGNHVATAARVQAENPASDILSGFLNVASDYAFCFLDLKIDLNVHLLKSGA